MTTNTTLGAPAGHDPDQPEAYRTVGSEQYMSAVEFLRRVFPGRRPIATELDTHAQTVLRLGQIAGSIGRGRAWGLRPVKLYHPAYPDGVNGWPYDLWAEAWHRFTDRYRSIWFEPTDEPIRLADILADQPSVFSGLSFTSPSGWVPAGLQAQVDQAVYLRKLDSLRKDQQWRAARELLLRPSETPETALEALTRRNTAAAVMYEIERKVLG